MCWVKRDNIWTLIGYAHEAYKHERCCPRTPNACPHSKLHTLLLANNWLKIRSKISDGTIYIFLFILKQVICSYKRLPVIVMKLIEKMWSDENQGTGLRGSALCLCPEGCRVKSQDCKCRINNMELYWRGVNVFLKFTIRNNFIGWLQCKQ